MNNLDNSFIGWIFLTAAVLVIAVPLIIHKFYKGGIKKVRIIKKRETEREFVNFSKTKFNDGNYMTFRNKTVDLIYDGRNIVHTLNCDANVFKKLHTGEEYVVVVRLNRVIKLVKNHNKKNCRSKNRGSK